MHSLTHDPRSAQDGSTSSEKCTPVPVKQFVCVPMGKFYTWLILFTQPVVLTNMKCDKKKNTSSLTTLQSQSITSAKCHNKITRHNDIIGKLVQRGKSTNWHNWSIADWETSINQLLSAVRSKITDTWDFFRSKCNPPTSMFSVILDEVKFEVEI